MHRSRKPTFYGWRVVGAAFVLAVFGLGMGFHGPAVYLHAVHQGTGWPLALISTAVTVHFLTGAVVVANLPALYRRFGVATVTKAGALLLAIGVFGWAVAAAPWQLFAATLLSGAGWVTMGVAAINAIVAPWFIRARPAALAMAYNGGNIGGVVFSPLWAAAISAIGFPAAAAAIGLVMAITMWVLAELVFSRTPQQMNLIPDGDAPGAPKISVTSFAALRLCIVRTRPPRACAIFSTRRNTSCWRLKCSRCCGLPSSPTSPTSRVSSMHAASSSSSP